MPTTATWPTLGMVINRWHTRSCLARCGQASPVRPGRGAYPPARAGSARLRLPASRCLRSIPGHGPRSGPSDLAELQAEVAQHAAQRGLQIDERVQHGLCREVSSARVSCDDTDLQCSGRNQPICSSRAIPSASRGSVLIGIAFSAAFTCRGTPKLRRPPPTKMNIPSDARSGDRYGREPHCPRGAAGNRHPTESEMSEAVPEKMWKQTQPWVIPTAALCAC